MFRYYLYSIEYGHMPFDPYYETNDKEQAISEAKHLNSTQNVTVYVVDRKPSTMYEEIFVAISSDFKNSYRRRK